jgi:hypothetical protein
LREFERLAGKDKFTAGSGTQPIQRTSEMPSEPLMHAVGLEIITVSSEDVHTGVEAQVSITPGEVLATETVVVLVWEGLDKPLLFGWKKFYRTPRIGRVYEHIPHCRCRNRTISRDIWRQSTMEHPLLGLLIPGPVPEEGDAFERLKRTPSGE